MIQVNDIVVYKNPMADEMFNGESLRFIVREVNDNRCFIEPVTSSLYYKPLTLALVEDLEKIQDFGM